MNFSGSQTGWTKQHNGRALLRMLQVSKGLERKGAKLHQLQANEQAKLDKAEERMEARAAAKRKRQEEKQAERAELKR